MNPDLQIKTTKRYKLAQVIGLICMCLFSTSCGIKHEIAELVEVEIISVWTTKDYNENWSMTTKFPHTIIEETETKRRHFISGDTWGKVGDTFKMEAKKL